MRWKGEDPFELEGMRLTNKGFELTFTTTVDPRWATQVENFAFTRYNYSYNSAYGSPQRNKEAVKVTSAVLKDKSTVVLQLESLKADRVYELRLSANLQSSKGMKLVNTLAFYTARRLKK